MAEFPALQLWTDAYLADTTDLSAEEHGVYLLLLMAAWRSPDCALRDDDKRLARTTRIGMKKWRRIRLVMQRFWVVEDGKWTQKRLLKERKRSDLYRAQKSQAGIASALKRKKTAPTDVATATATGNELPLPNPVSKKEATASSVDSAFENLWKSWQCHEVPKGHKAAALVEWKRHVRKAGLDPGMVASQAAAYCEECRRTNTKTAHVERWIKKHRWEDERIESNGIGKRHVDSPEQRRAAILEGMSDAGRLDPAVPPAVKH